MNATVRFWVIEGTLIAARGMSLKMGAEGIFVNGGKLLVGSEKEPFQDDFTFELEGHWHTPKLPVFGIKCIGVTSGHLELYGKPIQKTWVELAVTADAGSKTLEVLGTEASAWAAGSKMVIAATDRPDTDCSYDRNDHCQTEEVYLESAKANGENTVLHLKEALKYRHLAEDLKGPGGEDLSL